MRGIVLAGGSGSRLDPITRVASKHLQPVYDKPMIYYPLATLFEAGIRDILVISTPQDVGRYEALLGDGSQWGATISYAVQPRPDGLAQAFLVGEDFVGSDPVALILGDNIFHGPVGLRDLVGGFTEGAVIFGYIVGDPERYGVVEVDDSGAVLSLEEKPAHPRSTHAVPGLYLYDGRVVDLAKTLSPSPRGELEITDLNRAYLDLGMLRVHLLGNDVTWFDAGTFDSLLRASTFVADVQRRHSVKIGCLEEVAYRHGLIDHATLAALVDGLPDSPYRHYLQGVVTREGGP